MREECVSAVGDQVNPDSNLQPVNQDLIREKEFVHELKDADSSQA